MPDDEFGMWYVRTDGGEIRGPAPLNTLRAWAMQGLVRGGQEISKDREAWSRADSLPALGLEWIVRLPGEETVGPINQAAVQTLVRRGLFGMEDQIENVSSGVKLPVHVLLAPPGDAADDTRPAAPEPQPLPEVVEADTASESDPSAETGETASEQGPARRGLQLEFDDAQRREESPADAATAPAPAAPQTVAAQVLAAAAEETESAPPSPAGNRGDLSRIEEMAEELARERQRHSELRAAYEAKVFELKKMHQQTARRLEEQTVRGRAHEEAGKQLQATLGERVQDYERLAESAKSHLAELKASNEKMRAEREVQAEQVAGLRDRLAEAQRTVEEQGHRIRRLEQDAQEAGPLRARAGKLEAELEARKVDLEATREEMDRREEERREAERANAARVSELEQELRSATQALQSETAEREKQQRLLEGEMRRHDETRAHAVARQVELTEQVQRLKQQQAAADKQLRESGRTEQSLRDYIAHLEEEAASTASLIEAASRDLSALTNAAAG